MTERIGGATQRDFIGLCLLTLPLACTSAPPASPRDVADANDVGRTLAARNEIERTLLREVANLPTGSPRRVSEATVLAEAPYAAASGHTCRALTITMEQTKPSQHRLACGDGTAWFFVPDVFGGDAGLASE